MYTLVYENASLVEILLGENGDLNFLNRMKQIMRDKCLHDWMEVVRTESTAVFDAYFAFIVSGCLGLVQHWLKTGLKETPVQMARLTEKSLLTSFMCFPRILWNKASPLKSAVSVKISVAPLSNLWYKRRYSYGRKLKEKSYMTKDELYRETACVRIKKGAGRSLKAGGAWIYDNEIDTISGEYKDGDLVTAEDFDGYPLGHGFINTHSKLTVRMLSRKRDAVINDEFIEMRVRNAWEYRKATVDTSSCRVIFGEADFLPGIVIDKFSDVLVVESLALGIDRLKP